MPDDPSNQQSQPSNDQPPYQPEQPLQPDTPAQPYNPPVYQPVTPAPVEPLPVPQQPYQPVPTAFGSGPEYVNAQPPVAPKKSKKGLIIGIVIAAVLVVLAGGSVFAYNVVYQNPDKVVGDALVNAISAKTVSGTGTIDVKNDEYTVKITVSGRTTEEAAGYLGVKLDYKAGDLGYVVDGEGVFAPNGDLYVKVNNVKELVDNITKSSDGLLDYSLFNTVITKVDGNWVKIAGDDLGTFSEDLKNTQTCVADYTKSLTSDKALQKSATDEIVNVYSNNKFITIVEKLGSKDVNGVGSLGYKLDFDKEKTKSFSAGLAETQFGKKLKECDKSIDFNSIADSLKEDDANSTGSTELWASRFGHEITELIVAAEDDGTQSTIVFNPIFNKNEAIEIPKDFITIEEIQAEIEKAYTEYYSSLMTI